MACRPTTAVSFQTWPACGVPRRPGCLTAEGIAAIPVRIRIRECTPWNGDGWSLAHVECRRGAVTVVALEVD